MRFAWQRWALGAVWIVSGCGSDSDAPRDASVSDGTVLPDGRVIGDGWALDEICERTVRAGCERAARCRAIQSSDVAACIESNEASCPLELEALAAAVEAGRLTYDGRKAKACYTQLDSVSCDVSESLATPDCEGYLVGTVSLGEACYTTSRNECAEGYCLREAGACPGVCTAFGVEDDPCDATNDVRCASTMYCDTTSNTCQPLLAENDPCPSPGSPSCASGLVCFPSEKSAATCIPTKPTGTECSIDIECASGLCSDGECRKEAALGQECRLLEHCAEGQVCAGETPTAPHSVCLALKGEDEPCALSVHCEAGLFCPSSPGMCSPVGEAGAKCMFPLACGPELFCDPSVHECAPLSATTGPCDSDRQLGCSDPSDFCYWMDGTCTPRKSQGTLCGSSFECISGICTENRCTEPVPTCDGL